MLLYLICLWFRDINQTRFIRMLKQIKFSGLVECEIDAPAETRHKIRWLSYCWLQELVHAVAVVTLVGHLLTAPHLTAWPLLINCGWFRSSRCWSRAGTVRMCRTSTQETKNSAQQLHIQPTTEAADIYLLSTSVWFLFWSPKTCLLWIMSVSYFPAVFLSAGKLTLR